MILWEYLRTAIPLEYRIRLGKTGPEYENSDDVITEWLNSMGLDGWELLQIVTHDYQYSSARYFFKRPLINQTQTVVTRHPYR